MGVAEGTQDDGAGGATSTSPHHGMAKNMRAAARNANSRPTIQISEGCTFGSGQPREAAAGATRHALLRKLAGFFDDMDEPNACSPMSVTRHKGTIFGHHDPSSVGTAAKRFSFSEFSVALREDGDSGDGGDEEENAPGQANGGVVAGSAQDAGETDGARVPSVPGGAAAGDANGGQTLPPVPSRSAVGKRPEPLAFVPAPPPALSELLTGFVDSETSAKTPMSLTRRGGFARLADDVTVSPVSDPAPATTRKGERFDLDQQGRGTEV
eukprot:CAMPEP_0205920192 /NCGR_PEP_ID=MMETSP1325-20131115/10918_1 /ASSEMBLY_ACC=CAM_ASM_000708 /TAXON_ID=236786 /ORGANISM="Florenciella sp., Strain RCC1007" /LENGTH=267 /DNA_ID=CAMNT_0053287863 /DNA_START=379 /DNA_END=1182 /DNA_ORIENTATION=+